MKIFPDNLNNSYHGKKVEEISRALVGLLFRRGGLDPRIYEGPLTKFKKEDNQVKLYF